MLLDFLPFFTLAKNDLETFESCEGGDRHSFPEPTVRLEGAMSEGLRALSVALEYGLPVVRLRRVWGIEDRMIHGPWWEMTFDSLLRLSGVMYDVGL